LYSERRGKGKDKRRKKKKKKHKRQRESEEDDDDRLQSIPIGWPQESAEQYPETVTRVYVFVCCVFV